MEILPQMKKKKYSAEKKSWNMQGLDDWKGGLLMKAMHSLNGWIIIEWLASKKYTVINEQIDLCDSAQQAEMWVKNFPLINKCVCVISCIFCIVFFFKCDMTCEEKTSPNSLSPVDHCKFVLTSAGYTGACLNFMKRRNCSLSCVGEAAQIMFSHCIFLIWISSR